MLPGAKPRRNESPKSFELFFGHYRLAERNRRSFYKAILSKWLPLRGGASIDFIYSFIKLLTFQLQFISFSAIARGILMNWGRIGTEQFFEICAIPRLRKVTGECRA